jgi:uncharacterized repeat protein (TIGR01451 family)
MMRTLRLLLCLAAALPLTAQAVFDAQSSITDLLTPAAPTTTLAHTTTVAENRILLVSVHLNVKKATGANVSGVTYGGQALTFLAAINDSSNDSRTEVWYRLSPLTGNNNVVVTAAGMGGGDTVAAIVGATTYSNANQVAPGANTAEGHGSTAGVTVTGTTATDVVIDFLSSREVATFTPGAGQTPGYSVATGPSNDDVRAGSSRRAAVAGSTPMTWTLSKNVRWTQIGVRVARAVVDLAVTMTATDPGPDGVFFEGNTLDYTITVTNNGPSRATSVVVTDTLPPGYSFNSVTPGGPTCAHAAGTVTCNYGLMLSGASNVITIRGTVGTNTARLTNTATATRTQPDTNASNDSASHNADVVAPTVVHMLETGAVQDAKGKVRITWTTTFEAENLGFNVYRSTAAGRTKINKQLIAGSALFTTRSELGSGRSYRWSDKVKDGEYAQYFVEDVDLHGVATLHGPITPAIVGEVPESADTDTIADLGSAGGVFVSPRGIGAPRHPAIQATQARLEQQWDLASQAAVKLMVTQEGWYRVRFAELVAAGFVPGKKLSLFAEGIEQPMHVTGDSIEFYGTGIDTASGGARAYWLVSEKGSGARIKKEKAKKGASTAVRTPFTVERIERSVFFTALVNNGDRENFFGPVITTTSVSQTLPVENLDGAGGPASLEVVLQGATDGEHVVHVTVNGQLAGIARFANMERESVKLSLPLSMLTAGDNTVAFRAQNGSLDVSLLESVRLTYPHRLVADDDALKVTVAASSLVTASGFTSGQVRAIDVTDPLDPVELEVESSAAGSVSVVAPAGGTRTVLLIGESRIAAPAQIVASRPSTWNATTNGADMVIISARSFVSAAEPLKARRDAEGIATVVVDVQDLYDEFGFGERSPEAIREFLRRTRSWARPPRFVLLLGDASFDPRNYHGLGTFDFVPTKLVSTVYMKTASDDWLADFDGSGVPQLAVGRLPARTLAEAQTMIRKIVERSTAGNTQVNFVADPDKSWTFATAASSLAALVPPSLTTSVVTRPAAASFDSLLLTYFGHGSVDIWSAGRFRGSHASALRNAKLPVVAAMTCLNGYYHDVFMNSFAESLLLNPDGGAVAVWASSTLTEPVPQLDMAAELFRQLFAGATLGEAAMRAKSATSNPDVRRSWILFGDPSMALR